MKQSPVFLPPPVSGRYLLEAEMPEWKRRADFTSRTSPLRLIQINAEIHPFFFTGKKLLFFLAIIITSAFDF